MSAPLSLSTALGVRCCCQAPFSLGTKRFSNLPKVTQPVGVNSEFRLKHWLRSL